MWSPGRMNGKPLQYSCYKNLMNSIKWQKDMPLKDEPLRLEGVQYATEEEQRAITNSPGKMLMITLYAKQKKRHRCIEQSFGLCGRGKVGMIWENGIETCILSYMK